MSAFFSSLSLIFLLSAFPLLAADAPAPVPTAQAVASITVPDGFQATLFAGEPDVVQPIAMTTDPRGRLWVVECLSYPDWTTNKFGKDRISIFEDTDGDGHFDSKKIFWDKGRNLTGISLGLGGVWLCSLPELIFLPDNNADDIPDGPAEALLDGWDLNSKHNAFNGLTWGPDGWLYGCNGILGNSKVGKPGAPDKERIAFNCGVWRFHPTKRKFEVVANGTTNPWGIAFNEYGQMFVANCVIKHLFHIIPGAHYERMFGQDFNPYVFELIPSVADHIHWVGGFWKTEGATNPQNDTVGGGHAHCGAFIYLGDNWPQKYRGSFFTINIHGHRVNNDLLVAQGSGYVGKHTADFLRVNDSWFRGVSIIPSHDGGVYVSDWSDAGECHDYDDIHRENGRIYKIAYGESRTPRIDLRRLTDRDLIANLGERNEWLVSQSRLLLQERAHEGKMDPNTRLELTRLASPRQSEGLRENSPTRRLHSLWALHSTTGLLDARVMLFLQDPDPYIRAWTIQLALEENSATETVLSRLSEMAVNDPSPIVRLYLASALQRLPHKERLRIASGLVQHAEDAGDHNLPLMIWYGIEPIASTDNQTALQLLESAKIPLIRRFISERLSLRDAFEGLAGLLGRTSKAEVQEDVVRGMFLALNGRRNLSAPPDWPEIARKLQNHPSGDIRLEALQLSLIFGDSTAVTALKSKALNKTAERQERIEALEALDQTRQPHLVPVLQSLIEDPPVRLTVIKALAAYDDSTTPKLILQQYPHLTLEEKNSAISTLASRANYAAALAQAVQARVIPTSDIVPFVARQLQAYNDPRLESFLKELGSFRSVSGEKKSQIAKYKALLAPPALEKADLSHGRALFQRTCAGCHTLFDEGGKLAPELTGAQRSNLDYLLDNIVDPNAVVWDQYKATYFETKDDQLISGVVLRENESTVTIQTPTSIITLPRTEITSRRKGEISLMPEGLLDGLQKDEVIDLIAYLQSPNQVALKK